jgi:hypothetical protein
LEDGARLRGLAAHGAGGVGGSGVAGAIREASRIVESASDGSREGGERHARGRLTDTTLDAGRALLVALVSGRERA